MTLSVSARNLLLFAGGTRILLFYDCLPNKSATFFPNSSKNRGCNPYKKRVKVRSNHRRGINTEEKAKYVAAIWGTAFIKFLAALGRFLIIRRIAPG